MLQCVLDVHVDTVSQIDGWIDVSTDSKEDTYIDWEIGSQTST